MKLKPDPIDVHVGRRVRHRRTLLGMSQERLASELGLTFQQIQKYESAANRIGSGRLYRLSIIMDVQISYFFENMPDGILAMETPYEDAVKTSEARPQSNKSPKV